jgi:hypothetical protein
MKVIIHSATGLDYCKEQLEELLPGLLIENGGICEETKKEQFTKVDIDCIETIVEIIAINGYAHLWKETHYCGIDFFIDITEPSIR